MSTENPKLHFTPLKLTDNQMVLYEDNDLKLEAKITWNGKTINALKFTSDGLLGFKYKILDINRCTDENGIKFYMIHLLQHANTSEDPSIFQADISKIPSLTFNDTNDFAIFRFNIYYKQGIPLSKCTFHGTQPETKDGAIIVSI